MKAICFSSACLFAFLMTQNHVLAQDASSIVEVRTAGSIETAVVELDISGDANENATAQLEVQDAEGAWLPAHPLLRQDDTHFAGALFFLQAAHGYRLRISLQDPDNSSPGPQMEINISTHPDAPAEPTTPSEIYVSSTSGDDDNPGSQAEPFASINRAAQEATAGTAVHVGPGIYREHLQVEHSGQADNPVFFIAQPGAILDGSDAALAEGQTAWQDEGANIYSTDFDQACWYLSIDGERIYDYHSLADLQAANGGQTGQTDILAGGFFVDDQALRLFLRLPDGSNPNGRPIHAAILPGGFLLDGRQHVVIKDFEMRHYGNGEYSGFGVDIRESHHIWVQGCHIHNMNTGIRIRRSSSFNRVENCRIEDSSVWTWPWSSCKAHTCEASGISVTGGPGNVIRRNFIDGPFNGIYTGEFSDTPDPQTARNTDVYENEMHHIGDDALEPEGACVNVKFFDNRIFDVHNAISLAPIQRGPTWLVANLIVDYWAHALKLNNGSSGPILAYHNTALPAVDSESAQAMEPSLPFGPFTSKNNIWSARRYVIEYGGAGFLGAVDMDYDNLFTDRTDSGPVIKWENQRYDSLADFTSATGLEQNGFDLLPEFTDPAQGDYSLTEGHGLRDQGLLIPGINDSLERVPDGLPDLGAMEQSPQVSPDAGVEDAGLEDAGTEDAGIDAGGTDASVEDGGASQDSDEKVSGDCGCQGAGAKNAAWLWLLGLWLVSRRRSG